LAIDSNSVFFFFFFLREIAAKNFMEIIFMWDIFAGAANRD
jgi:hypothetical protein